MVFNKKEDKMKITRKTGLIIAGATLAVVMVLSLGAIAFAQSRGNGFGTGSCPAAVTELLGMTPAEIQAQRSEGKSLVQIAAAKGVTEVQLKNAIMAERQTQLQERVTAGTLTQEQVNLMLQSMEQNIEQAINRTTTGRPDWAGINGSGQGMRAYGNGVCQGSLGGCGGARQNRASW
jgi:hypothetical protein